MSKGVPAFERLVEAFSSLPGIGRRSAQRIALHLIKQPSEQALTLAQSISDFTQQLKICSICGNISETEPCPICANAQRKRQTILVVEQPTDVTSIENTGMYQGMYHVLMGRLAPLEGVRPGDLNIAGLLSRVAQQDVLEVIIGTNPTLEGDGTALYLVDKLAKYPVRVTRLARGMPTGASVASVSKAVLSDALQGRRLVDA